MNNKLLIGSLLSIIILVGVSFTSVVGNSNIDSNIRVSPLFNIRTNRAIEEEGKGIVCEYVGNDRSILTFPSKNDGKVIQVIESINRISKMSEKAYFNFIEIISNQLQNKDKLKIINIKSLILTLNRYRNLPLSERNYNNLDIDESPIFSASDPMICTSGGIWCPGCWIWEIIDTIITILLLIPVIFYTCGPCGPHPNTW